jgi:hypothetical protein
VFFGAGRGSQLANPLVWIKKGELKWTANMLRKWLKYLWFRSIGREYIGHGNNGFGAYTLVAEHMQVVNLTGLY